MSRGRIHPDDIALVRAKAPIEDIISERVTLRQVGANMSGLCPFHDDSSPSFTVSPDRGLWTCFGCGMGGDIISFVQEAEGLPFVEAVQRLADRAGITLRYLDSDPDYVAPPPGQRRRLVAVNVAANDFFISHLFDAEAAAGREYLTERKFDEAAWAQFSVGYAPNSREALLRHLRSAGFTEDEVVLAGVAIKNEDGRVYDRFRGRLTWAIRDVSGDIVGFGARRLFEDDKGPKWLNSPDTPLYRKSEVLYGIDAARRDIATTKQIVVVEGYGDVMAAHLAGVTTAVATCGTAFGEGHIKIVRRLLRDDNAYTGKVIFTFDGDAAGQKAAMRAFRDNHRFTAQTYVAVAPDSMDPCDLRLHRGDEAVRDLVAAATPLVEFVIKTTLTGYDLGTSEGRVAALKVTAPLVAGVKDQAMRTEYARRLTGWLALPDHTVRSAVTYAARQLSAAPSDAEEPAAAPSGNAWRPDPADQGLAGEREAAKCLLQVPEHAQSWLDDLSGEAFTHKAYRGIYSLSLLVEQTVDPNARLHQVREKASGDEHVAGFVNELAVEPLRAGNADLAVYVAEVMGRLLDRHLERQVASLKARLGEVADAAVTAQILGEVMQIEARRRTLRTR
jgi:DNA primase